MTIKIAEKYRRYIHKAYKFIQKKEVNTAIKYAVVVTCFFILFDRLTKSEFKPMFWVNTAYFYVLIPIFITLSFLNFFIDVLLWASISKGSRRMRLSHYARHHLISLSMGFITPNNLGEYGGKIRQFGAPVSKVKGFLLAFHFRTVKTVARNILGLFALVLLFYISEQFFLKDWHIILFTIVVVTHLILYWNIEYFLPLISHISIQGKNYFQLFLRIRTTAIEKLKWIGLSALKFIIYTSQLTLLLATVIPESSDISNYYIWMYVAFYYSLASYLPTIMVFDPIVKGAVGILLLKHLPVGDWTILSAVTLVWMANVAIPSVIGSLMWVRRKQIH